VTLLHLASGEVIADNVFPGPVLEAGAEAVIEAVEAQLVFPAGGMTPGEYAVRVELNPPADEGDVFQCGDATESNDAACIHFMLPLVQGGFTPTACTDFD